MPKFGIYSSAALNYRQSFFAPPLGDPSVVDAEHDAKHEAVLAQMRAIAAQQPSTEEAARFALHDSTSAIAAALGFGTMHSVVMYGSMLAGSGGPATMYAESCSTVPLVVVSGKNGGTQ